MDLQQIISLVLGLLNVVIIILSLIIGISKNKKTTNDCKTALDFVTALRDYIVSAEQKQNYSGQEKKSLVELQAQLWCINHNYKVDEKTISEMIDEEVAFTNTINAKVR